MVDAPFTAVRNTPNKSVRQNVARRGVILHHAAMTSLSGLRSLAMGAKQVSADAIVKDGVAEKLIPDGFRAWSVGSAYWDSAMRSVETANDSTNGWTISDESHWTLARLVAYWAEQDGFYPHRSGPPATWTVIGHREVYSIHGASYATACPGALDLHLVTARAQQILDGNVEDDMAGYDRAEVVGGIHATIQEVRNLAALVRTNAPKLELVRAIGGTEVWYSVNRAERYLLPNEKTVRDYQYWIANTAKQSSEIREVANLDAFGAPSTEPVPVVPEEPVEDEAE